MIAWLIKEPCAAPALTSVLLPLSGGYFHKCDVLDKVFRFYATYVGLERLHLGCGSAYHSPEVSLETIERVAKTADDAVIGIDRENGTTRRGEAMASTRLEDQQVRFASQLAKRRQPFAKLHELAITVSSSAVAALTKLLPPTLTHLSIFLPLS